MPLPKAKPIAVNLPPATAARLAIYGADYDLGVLAPRGWHCAHLYGSSGAFTIVAEEEVTPNTLFANRPIRGPAIQISMSNGGTSGRFEVAQLIGRYFPHRHAFLDRVIREGIEPARSFPRQPYKSDLVVARRRDFIEVITPAGHKGLGTQSRLDASDLPIHAVASVRGGVDEDWAGYVFSVRLPNRQEDVVPVILKWAEHTYLEAK